jgi:lipopolysaccharide biosynthesis glycosyltransferase
MKEINIAISASSSYIEYARVMMASVYAAHPKDKINLFVFYVDDKVASYQKILKRQSRNNNESNSVNFIKVDYELLKKVDNGKGWAIDLWARWYALDFLSKDYDRVLLLGIDTFIRSDISEFYFQDMLGYYFACTTDMNISNTEPSDWPEIKADMDRMGLEDKKKYINGDVVLVNLKETHAKISLREFVDLYAKNQFKCWDQDVITYCFNSHVKFQDSYIYNYFPNLNLDNVKDAENMKDVKILHFAGGPKPWLVAPWDAKKFNGIPEWWEVAKKEGHLDLDKYLRFVKRALLKFLKSKP